MKAQLSMVAVLSRDSDTNEDILVENRRMNTMGFMLTTNIDHDVEIATPGGSVTIPARARDKEGYLGTPGYSIADANPYKQETSSSSLAVVQNWQFVEPPCPWYTITVDGQLAAAGLIRKMRAAFVTFAMPIYPDNTLGGLNGEQPGTVSEERLATPGLEPVVHSEEISSSQITSSRSVALLTAPDIPGYTFKGWYAKGYYGGVDLVNTSPQDYTSRASVNGEFKYTNYGGNWEALGRNGYNAAVSTTDHTLWLYDLLYNQLTMPAFRWRWWFQKYHNKSDQGFSCYSATRGCLIHVILAKTWRKYIYGYDEYILATFEFAGQDYVIDTRTAGPGRVIMNSRGVPCAPVTWSYFENKPTNMVNASEATAFAVAMAESVVFNCLCAVYEKSVTVTFNANGGTCSEETRAVNLDIDTGTATLTNLPTPTWSGCRFEGWYLGDWTKPTTLVEDGYVISGPVVLKARWSQVMQPIVKTGIFTIEGTYYQPTTPAPGQPFDVRVYQDTPTYVWFKEWGGPWNISVVGATYDNWVEWGRTGYYKAYQLFPPYGGAPLTERNPLVFRFGQAMPSFTLEADLPVRIDRETAEAWYSIDGGTPQQLVFKPSGWNAQQVAWIRGVALGSTVRVWGIPADEADILNATEANPLTFTTTGTGADIVGFSFYIRKASERVYEIAFDNRFLVSQYLETAGAAYGRLVAKQDSRQIVIHPGLSIETIQVNWGCGFVLFADAADAMSSFGPGEWSAPVSAGAAMTLAIDVAVDDNPYESEDTDIDPETADTSLTHASAGVAFLDVNGEILLDANDDPVVYWMPQGPTASPRLDFTVPAGAAAAQLLFRCDALHKADFRNVRLIETGTFDNVSVSGVDPATDGVAAYARRFVCPVADGPAYGSIRSLPTPSRQYHNFIGWRLSDTSAAVNDKTVILRRSAVLLSTFQGMEIVHLLDAIGGDFPDEGAWYWKGRYGEPYGQLPTPVWPGHTFEGWYTAPSGGTLITPSTIVTATGTVQIYARWSVNGAGVHTITFNAAGGSVGEVTRNVNEGAAYGQLPTPTWPGRTFIGWFDALGSQATAATIMGTIDVYLTARWSGGGSTITFNANGGAVDETSRFIATGEIIDDMPTPTRAGQNFDGWFTAAEGGGRITGSYVPTGDMTLYAHWKDTQAFHTKITKKSIQLILNGGEVDSSYGELKFIIGIAKALPTAAQVTKAGSTFGGWYTSADFTGSAVTAIPDTTTRTATYYAKWI